MILADTNAWVRHLRQGDERLARYLRENRVVTSDVVVGELQLGAGIPPSVATMLALLPVVPGPSTEATRRFIARHQRTLRASGVGWADAQVILSAAGSGALLYTNDRPLSTVWRRLGHRLA